MLCRVAIYTSFFEFNLAFNFFFAIEFSLIASFQFPFCLIDKHEVRWIWRLGCAREWFYRHKLQLFTFHWRLVEEPLENPVQMTEWKHYISMKVVPCRKISDQGKGWRGEGCEEKKNKKYIKENMAIVGYVNH